MSYKLQYIGPTQTFKAASLNPAISDLIEISLEQNQIYIVELQMDGSVMMMDGQLMIPEDTGIWVSIPSLGGLLAYTPEAILKQWKMV